MNTSIAVVRNMFKKDPSVNIDRITSAAYRKMMGLPVNNTCETNYSTLGNLMLKNQIHYNCLECGRECACSPSQKRKYCSSQCAYKSKLRVAHCKKKDRGERVCKNCDTVFKVHTKAPDAQFCCQKCAASFTGKTTLQENRGKRPVTDVCTKNCPSCGKEFVSKISANRKYCSYQCSADNLDGKKKRVQSLRENGGAVRQYSHGKSQWVELGGKRCYFRSTWEVKYARYLEWMKSRGEILDWEFEPHTFWFDNIKRGCRSYLPDFRVTFHDGTHQWHEVKGWMTAKSKTKLKRMKKYYPLEQVVVLSKPWFKEANLKLSKVIPDWGNTKL